MGIARAQVSFERTTGIPKDRVVNTFHFSTPTVGGVTLAEAVNIQEILQSFYVDANTGGSTIQGLMSSVIATSGHTCKVYDLEDPEPRTPVGDFGFSLTPAVSTSVLPSEVALVMSVRAAPVSGTPIARTRGRVYLGPWTGGAASTASAGDGRPTSTLMASIRIAGLRLMSDPDTVFGVWSPTDLTFRPAVRVVINNAWDTQRSRGADPTAQESAIAP